MNENTTNKTESTNAIATGAMVKEARAELLDTKIKVNLPDSIKNPVLRQVTEELVMLADDVNRYSEIAQRKLAKTMFKVSDKKLYESDGFKNMSEYAETIGIGKSRASQLVSAGRILLDSKAPVQLTKLPVAVLVEIASAYKDDDLKALIYKDAENGGLAGMGQKDAREYAHGLKNTKPSTKVEKTVDVYDRRGNAVIENVRASETVSAIAEYYDAPIVQKLNSTKEVKLENPTYAVVRFDGGSATAIVVTAKPHATAAVTDPLEIAMVTSIRVKLQNGIPLAPDEVPYYESHKDRFTADVQK